MQETFLRAFEYLQKGKEVENMRALLYRIANNLIIDFVRKKKEMSLDALAEEGFDPTGKEDERMKNRIEEERVRSTMKNLKSEDRELITMRYVDGMKPQEISEFLGESPNVISVRLHRAMKALELLIGKA